MIKTIFITMMLLTGLTACQSIPGERKSNCACLWQDPVGVTTMEGLNA
jgi:hypothetical protein